MLILLKVFVKKIFTVLIVAQICLDVKA